VQALEPFDLILFGATGDLSMRKLLPALYRRHCAQQLPDNGRIVATARSEIDRETFLENVYSNFAQRLDAEELTQDHWHSFAKRLHFVSIDATQPRGFEDLARCLAGREQCTRVFFLAVAPAHFVAICENLEQQQLVTKRSRVVLEKPLGHDLASAQSISERIGAIFAEDAIYRIDHYLGKETVQNLMALRFEVLNGFFA